jgi:hypothetical protein
MVLILVLYVIAAAVNLYIPRVAIDHKLRGRRRCISCTTSGTPSASLARSITSLARRHHVVLGRGRHAAPHRADLGKVALKFDLEKATQLTARSPQWASGLVQCWPARFVSLQRRHAARGDRDGRAVMSDVHHQLAGAIVMPC